MCTLGIFVSALMGLYIPNDPENYADEFKVKGYFRVVWGLPLVFVALQTILMLTVFNYTTPLELKKNGNFDKLYSLMKSMYPKNDVQARVQAIQTDDGEGFVARKPSLSETFCDPTIRRAAYVGTLLSVLQ